MFVITGNQNQSPAALRSIYNEEKGELILSPADMKTLSEATEPTVDEGVHPTETGPGNVVIVDSAPGVDIITRVTNIPVVSSTIGQVTSMYTWTKENSALANTALGYAERSVSMAAQTAKPVVDRLEKPITMANDFACHQLDKLEEKVPLITKPTEEVVSTIQDGTRQVIEDTKQKGADGLNTLMNTRMGKAVSFGMDTALAVSEYAVEYYLPPDETEKKDEVQDDYEKDETMEKTTPSSVQRVGILTTKVRQRVHKKALMNIRYAQKRSQETIDKLHFTVDLIDYAKNRIDGANQMVRTNVGAANQMIRTNAGAANQVIRTNVGAANQMIRTNVEAANQVVRTKSEQLWTTWNDWTTIEEGENKEANSTEVDEKEGEQKTLAIARQLAARLRGLSHNIAGSVAVLPKHVRARIEENVALADAFYRSFEEAHYFSDIPTSILTTSREQLNKLSHATMQVADYFINSYPLQWLLPGELPNIEMEGVEFDYMPGSDQNDVDLTSESSEF